MYARSAMEIVMFFVLFLQITESVTAAESGLTNLRDRWQTRAADVLRVVEKSSESSECKEFEVALKQLFKGKDAILMGSQKYALNGLTAVRKNLKTVVYQFMLQSHGYVTQLLRKYLQLSVYVIDEVDAQNERSVSRFLDGHDYCVLTALYDSGMEVGLLFDIVFTLQSIRLDSDPEERRRLMMHLREFQGQLDIRLDWMGISLRPSALNSYSYKEHVAKLEVVGRKITEFSRMFCSRRWRPFVRRYSVFAAMDLKDAVHHDEWPFVRHVFREEICAIYFQKNDIKVQNQKYLFKKWKCAMILKSAEYGIEKYERDVTKKEITSSKRNSESTIGIKLVRGKNMLSLAQLKDALKSNGFYLNVVKYYNVVADVMLMVSIKEGTKILKGIKLVVQRDCKENTETIRVGEMRELRSVLSEFKSVFDDLVFLFHRKERINVMRNPQKVEFYGRVKSIMELLDFREKRNDEEDRGNCEELLKEVADIRGNAHLSDDIHMFEKYYFFQPLLNIRELYQFSKTDF